MTKKYSQNKLRSIGREYALQALFQVELNPQVTVANWNDEEEAIDDEASEYSLSGEDRDVARQFAKLLYLGVVDRKSEIDATLNAAFDKGRTIARTAHVDRCILRLAAFEMTVLKTPKAVVISEAIELGNKFGDVKTRAFLNGVLDQIGKSAPDASAQAAD